MDGDDYPYQRGTIRLGYDSKNRETGVPIKAHAITFGGARTGKGATLIIPNLRRWPHNALVIDVKGENAQHTWEAREADRQRVAVLDPYNAAQVPARLRCSINPLAGIQPDGFTAGEDVRFLAEGLIIRRDTKDAGWDDGARDILAGVIAYVIGTMPPENRNLTAMRELLLQSDAALYETAQHMLDCDACGGLARASGLTIMTALESESGRPSKFLEGARSATAWLDTPPMRKVFGEDATFDINWLKNRAATLYLVLPPKYLATGAGFFRLFVQLALAAMQGGPDPLNGRRCLFILDEAHALGKMEDVSKSAGLMPGYGVHLWPFFQDLGQMHELYGKTGSETFFGNADLQIFFGNSDMLTLEYVSKIFGERKLEELPPPPPPPVIPQWGGTSGEAARDYREWARDIQSAHERKMSQYRFAANAILNKPRMPHDDLRRLIAKPQGEELARQAVVFTKSGHTLTPFLHPYWEPDRKLLPPPREPDPWQRKRRMKEAQRIKQFCFLTGRIPTFDDELEITRDYEREREREIEEGDELKGAWILGGIATATGAALTFWTQANLSPLVLGVMAGVAIPYFVRKHMLEALDREQRAFTRSLVAMRKQAHAQYKERLPEMREATAKLMRAEEMQAAAVAEFLRREGEDVRRDWIEDIKDSPELQEWILGGGEVAYSENLDRLYPRMTRTIEEAPADEEGEGEESSPTAELVSPVQPSSVTVTLGMDAMTGAGNAAPQSAAAVEADIKRLEIELAQHEERVAELRRETESRQEPRD